MLRNTNRSNSRHVRGVLWASIALTLLMITGCRGDSSDDGAPIDCCSRLSEQVTIDGSIPSIYSWLEQGEVELADELVAGIWTLPRFTSVEMEEPRWDVDPFGEKYWRYIYYSLRHTRHLIAAYDATGDPKYLETLRTIVLSYVRHEAYKTEAARDPHTSAFLSMMLTNIARRLDQESFLDGRSLNQIADAIIDVNEHLLKEENFEAQHNHGITQSAALLFSGTVFGDQTWQRVGKSRLLEVMETNVDADGAQIEQSPGYHFYVLLFFWQIHHWAAEVGVELPPDFEERTRAMVEFGQWLIKPNGRLPLLGATVDKPRRPAEEHEYLYRELDAEFPTFRWFRSAGSEGEPPATRSRSYWTAGFGFARFGLDHPGDPDNQTFFAFDSGPYRTNHSDLDALSVVWSPLNFDVLVDSGLYSLERSDYHAYFRSTAAHNTIVVGDGSQKEGAAQLRAHEEIGEVIYFSGEHQLYEETRHVRVTLVLGRTALTVIDLVETANDDVRQAWNLSPSIELEPDADGLRLHADDWDHTVEVNWIGGDLGETTMGQEDPVVDGWYSADYEIRLPARTFYIRKPIDSTRPIVTSFATAGTTVTAHYEEDDSVLITAVEAGGRTFRVRVEDIGSDDESIHVD